MSRIPEFPATLTKLIITYCPEITSLPNLPSRLDYLYVIACPSLATLPVTFMSPKPSGTKTSDAVGDLASSEGGSLTQPGLRYPECSDCPLLLSLPFLPDGLHECTWPALSPCSSSGFAEAAHIRILPPSCNACLRPESLLQFCCAACPLVTSVPLPPSLCTLSIADCPRLSTLPPLPPYCTVGALTGCPLLPYWLSMPEYMTVQQIGRKFQLTRLQRRFRQRWRVRVARAGVCALVLCARSLGISLPVLVRGK